MPCSMPARTFPKIWGCARRSTKSPSLDATPQGSPSLPVKGAHQRALAVAFSQGARDVAGALRQWMSRDQARQLESHLAHGRVLLWVRPLGSKNSAVFAAISPAPAPRGRGLRRIGEGRQISPGNLILKAKQLQS